MRTPNTLIIRALCAISMGALTMPAQAATTRVLLSAFEPFGGREENSSQVIAESFVQSWNANPADHVGVEADLVILPVSYEHAPIELLRKIDSFHPEVIVSIGEASESYIRLEERARNMDTSPMADNDGDARMDQVIVPGAPTYYRTQFPLFDIYNKLKAAKYEVRSSTDAGGYVCNHLFYRLMHAVNTESTLKGVKAGFLHVPARSSSDGDYSVWGAKAVKIVVDSLR